MLVVKGVVIYGELRKGNRPVVDAVVTAEIDGRNGSVQLKDDGAGNAFHTCTHGILIICLQGPQSKMVNIQYQSIEALNL